MLFEVIDWDGDNATLPVENDLAALEANNRTRFTERLCAKRFGMKKEPDRSLARVLVLK